MKYWLKALVGDALLVAAFYLWQRGGIDDAGNVFVFVIWVHGVLRLIGAGISAEDWEARVAKHPRPTGFGVYIAVSNTACVLALVWIGYIWLPAIYMLSALLYEGRHKKAADLVQARGMA